MNEQINELLNTLTNTSMADIELVFSQLHFIRSDWFYALIPLLLFLLFSLKKSQNKKNWRSVIDPQLLPYVLSRAAEVKQRRYPLILVFIAVTLCITALAGPTYKKLPQAVYREQSSLVILLDLSQSMNASDIKPTRLERAKLELLDILNARKTGQTALIVYAADAFVVTPLTDDNTTIDNLVPALQTEMMPAQGSNLSKALSKTFSLFSQAGIISGDILVVTDDIHQRDESAIKKVSSQGHRLSIFGIGTSEGGPVPLDGGFLQDRNGAIVIPKLDTGKLRQYALQGGGLYTGIKADDSDINKLSALFQSSEIEREENNSASNNDLHADIWQEEGHWLLLPLLFFAALWSRKGWVAAFIPFVIPLLLLTALTLPKPVYAETDTDIIKKSQALIDTDNLWSSSDQKAMKAFNRGETKEAADKFSRSDWKASAYYRNGDYEAAVKTLENRDDSESLYNKANALAKLGKYEDAIKAYDASIGINDDNDDAKYNRELVQQALKKQQQNNEQKGEQGEPDPDQKDTGQDDSEQDDSGQKNKQSDSEKNSASDSQQQNKNGEYGEKSEDKSKQQQNSDKPQNSENKQAENEQLKQRDAQAEKEEQKKQQEQYQQSQEEEKQQQDADKQSNDKQDNKNQSVENQPEEDNKNKPAEIEINPREASITEQEKATEQWLKRIPDDPGGLLRRKFYYQYKQIPNQQDDVQPW